jgi:hypothetical protein
MLAWWGVFPFLVYVAGEIIWAWPEAHLRASRPEFALSYFLGGVLGGILIALVISWLSYRIGRRSQLAGTIAFTAVILLVTLSVAHQAERRRIGQGGTQGLNLSSRVSFGDFLFKVPARWSIVRPDREKTAAILVLNAAGPTSYDAILKVDTGNPFYATALRSAQAIAGKDGHVQPEQVFVDGAPGYRVETGSQDLSRPQLVVVIERGGKLYLIMASTTGSQDIAGPFNEILASWRWANKER